METYRVLVTGGAGFIGSFIVDKLVEKGHEVTIFDSLAEQVHQGKVPAYINRKAKLVKGNVTDYKAFKEVLRDAEVVFHEAAAVGVGQSMYEVRHYINDNIVGTANLLEFVANEKHNLKKVLVAGSMSSYGEGLYECGKCREKVKPELRTEEQLKKAQWEPLCRNCGSSLRPVPTPEETPMTSTSIYAITKKAQEEMVLSIGRAYGVPSVALRYFNVYGPRQSLNNPYTGVAAIFMSRIKNSHAPVLYEDGMQTRDFVSVHDIAQANILAMEKEAANYGVFNVGTQQPTTILGVAETLAKVYKSSVRPTVSNKFRKGDIRHCISDISKISRKLGYRPSMSFEEGMRELVEWSRGQQAEDMVEQANEELRKKGLL